MDFIPPNASACGPPKTRAGVRVPGTYGWLLLACTVLTFLILAGHGCTDETKPDPNAPILLVVPDTLAFGTVGIGSSAELTFTIGNIGGGLLAGNLAESCADFAIVSGGGSYSLGAEENREVRVRFAPTAAGSSECVIPITEGARVRCMGEGLVPPACSFSPDSLDFGPIMIGRYVVLGFTITNSGGGTLSGSVGSGSGAFTVVSGNGPFELDAGAGFMVAVGFVPTEAGPAECWIEMGGDLCADYRCFGEGVPVPPVCLVEPDTLDFGAVEIGSASERSFTITNKSPISLAGTLASQCDDYEIIGGGGAYELASQESLEVRIRFSPTTEGAGACVIDPGHHLCDRVLCNGIGLLPPHCSLDPQSLDFGSLAAGASRDLSFTIENTGGGSLTGTVSESCEDYEIVTGSGSYSLYGGQKRTVTVRFTPAEDGLHECTVETGDESCGSVPCSGIGTEGTCSVAPAALDFGAVEIGSSLDRRFTIDNVGVSLLTGAVTETCQAFSIVSGGGSYSLNPGDAARVVTVRFSPSSVGVQECTVGTGSLCEPVRCTGDGSVSSACSVTPVHIDFGNVDVGGSLDLPLLITNTGTEPFSGTVGETCSEFEIVSGGGEYTLNPGMDRRVVARFSPASSGPKSCTIETGSAHCSDVDCNGRGTGEEPVCAITPMILDFGDVETGEESELSFTITNAGGGTVAGSASVACEDFLIVSGAGEYSLENEETWTVAVRFAPGSTGTKSCTIETGSELCADVSCNGEGIAIPPICSVSADTLDFGGVPLGASEDRSFTITNTGGSVLNGSVTESCEHYSIIAGAGDYSLEGSEQHEVTVRFAPVSEGILPCTIETGTELCGGVFCSGEGIGPACGVWPTTLAFGEILVGESEDLTVAITNTGGGVLNGNVDAECDQFFVIEGQGLYELAAGDSHEVTIRFVPGTDGADTCTVETSNDLCGDVLCMGAGIGSSCEVSPTYLDFGNVEVDSTSELSFSITNVGGGKILGDIEIEQPCPYYELVSGGGGYDLGAGESQEVRVRYTPYEMGVHICTIGTGDALCADVSCAGEGIGPICSLDPAALDFGTVLVGASADTTFTITNSGAGGILAGIVNEACEHYSILSGGGAYALEAGETLAVAVRFAPLADGPLPCTIETGNELCGDVACLGEGAGPVCEIEPPSLDFGQVVVDSTAELSFSITNAGGGWLNGEPSELCSFYEIVSGGGAYNLGSGESREVRVRYAPGGMGIHNCTIETGDALCADVDCTGEGVGPICSVEPIALDFGSVNIGETVDSTFTITNVGTGGFLTGTVSEDCAHYSISPADEFYRLGVDEELIVTVRFTPMASGTLDCTIDTGNSLCSDVTCTGEGIGPVCEVQPANLDFEQVEIDSTAERSYTIMNIGGGTLHGTVSESCSHYSIVLGGGPYSLDAGESVIVTVAFAPESLGVHNCTILNGTGLCTDVACTGEGIGPICSIDPVAIDFGQVAVGAFADSIFTIANTGTGGILEGTVSEECNGYSIIAGGGPYSLGIGEEWTVTVRFEPDSPGAAECTIETGNEDCSNVACTGEGLGPVCEVSPTELDFGQVDVGATEELDFTIKNIGGGSLEGTVSDTCGFYSIVAGGDPYDLGGGDSVVVTVRYAPEGAGVHACTIETGHDDCADVSCTGEGCPVCPASPLTVFAGSDVTVLLEHPDSNSCGRTVNLAGHTGDGSNDLETLLRFDVSAIPPEATITAAQLEMHVDSCTYTPPDDTVLISLSRLDAAFDECSVTWDTAPAATPISGCTDTLYCAPAGYQVIACTGLIATIQEWIESPATNYGIEVVPAATESGAIVLRSHHHPESTPPRLVIYFTCPCP